MPIVTPPPTPGAEAVLVDLNGLVFNQTANEKVHTLDGWWDTLQLDVKMTSAAGPGSVATGPWVEKERYLTVGGHFLGVDPFFARRALIAAFPPGNESPITVTYPSGVKETMYVRPYDQFDLVPKGSQLRFVLPLVALDPFKYGTDPAAGDMGVYTGGTWFREYADAGTDWTRDYTLTGGVWVRSYQQIVPTGPFPTSLTLTSDGDVESRRITFEITGPLPGEWWLLDEGTNRRSWVDRELAGDQTLTLDSRHRTATLDGEDVSDQVFGEWLTFAPGQNTYRLVTGDQSDAYAHVEASPAYQ